MKYIGVKEKSCKLYDIPLSPFEETVVYKWLIDGKLYARCNRCECDGCMIEVKEMK
jgi:hypothetical protein